MTFSDEKSLVDSELQRRGVTTGGMTAVYQNTALSSVRDLLELLQFVQTAQSYYIILGAIFLRKPTKTDKELIIEVILKRLREFNPRDRDERTFLSLVIMNPLAKSVAAKHVDEIQRIMFDERYDSLRQDFTYVLYKIRTPAAIQCLKKAALDATLATSALYALSRLKTEETVSLCERALKNPDISPQDKQSIRETLRTLKRKLRAGQVSYSHLTQQSMPKGLVEWSSNLDDIGLLKVLRKIQQMCESGFTKSEIVEVRSAADNLELNDAIRFRFDVIVEGRQEVLWVELFCDDEQAIDLCLFGSPELIAMLEKTT